ncbi:hypothetical protein Trydic_g13681 [Trypoxylus dichotomus]
MSFGRRPTNFMKQNSLSSVGQRRPAPFQNAGGQFMMNRCYLQPGFQNKQPLQGPPHQQQQQNLQAQQQQFQAQLQQQEKARAAQQAMQNQVNPKPVQKPVPPPAPVKQQPISNQQQQQQPPKPPTNAQQQPPKPQINTQQQPPKPQINTPQQPPKPPTNTQQVDEQIITEQSDVAENKSVVTTNPMEIPALGDGVDSTAMETAVQHRPRPFWMKRNGRINRAERAKRRNIRLRKLLQPKNALMIINELVGHVPFEISETKTGNAFEDVYKASVNVEGKDHVGFGKSKALAKTSAAEMAVRSMILNKLRITAQPPPVADEELKDMKMEVTEENQDDVSWTHIASFAIHKLFSSWGDDGNMADMISRSSSYVSLNENNLSAKDSTSSIQAQPEQKPAKRLPENAALMNPIMLLNQMHPSAKYEELGKTGTPPHIQFTIKCTVGNQSFIGTGSNKKAARKQATFEACKTLLGIQYPPDILQGTSPDKVAPMETV